MKVSIKFAGTLAGLTNNNKKIDYELKSPSSLDKLIDLVDQQFSGFRSGICTKQKEVADHINVYVNGDNVRHLDGLNTELKDGDAIHVIPAAAAG
jgi:sulfur-carrier protein